MIINELLAYVVFYRDRCTSSDLHHLIVRFYSLSEISIAKSTVLSQFETQHTSCQYATNRCHTTRPAHEAEAEDILGMIELLDNLHVLDTIQFAAVSMERLHKYGPNEVNICTVVDKQLQIDKELNALKDAKLNAVCDKTTDAVSKRLNSVTDTFNEQLRPFESLCQSLKTMTTSATDLVAKSRTSTIPATPTDDRSATIIVCFWAD
jgi:hypothetical protein